MKIILSSLVAVVVLASTLTSVTRAQNSDLCHSRKITAVRYYKRTQSYLKKYERWGRRYNDTIDRKDCPGLRRALDKMGDLARLVAINAKRCRSHFGFAVYRCTQNRTLLRKGRGNCRHWHSEITKKIEWVADLQRKFRRRPNCSFPSSKSPPAKKPKNAATATTKTATTKTATTTTTGRIPSGICDRVSTGLGDAWYCVSSKLPNNSRTRYNPRLMADNSGKTAWIEGAKGFGIGEWIKVQFVNGAKQVSRIVFRNGFPHDERRFKGNARLQFVRLEMSDGTRLKLRLQDVQGLQSYKLPSPKSLTWVKITILSVYPGSLWQDTALSELHLK